MARDYKNSGRVRSKRRTGPSGGLMLAIGLFSGVVIGVVIGLGVVATRTYTEIRQQITQEMAAGTNPTGRLANQGVAATDNRPRFEFYKILPEMEVVVPEEEARKLTAPKPAKPSTAPAPAASKERYLLQVASFQNHADADRLKAQLALLGIEASIQTVEIKGGQTWHRVRAGPFRSNELAPMRERLQANGIESILLKISG